MSTGAVNMGDHEYEHSDICVGGADTGEYSDTNFEVSQKWCKISKILLQNKLKLE